MKKKSKQNEDRCLVYEVSVKDCHQYTDEIDEQCNAWQLGLTWDY